MELRYLAHSGFAVEGDGLTLVFDYYRDTCTGKRCPENGVLDSEYLRRPGKFYVFASHSHGDHFNDVVLGWSNRRKDIVCILSEDIREVCSRQDNNIFYLKKGNVYNDETLTAEAFGSTDIGISFLVTLKIDGKTIFHAGDLNNWHWREEVPPDEAKEYEDAYLSELSEIARRYKFIDTVMFPVDPRLGKDYMLGATQFLEQIKAGIFSPMHFWDDYNAAAAFQTHAEESGAKFACWNSRGQTIKI